MTATVVPLRPSLPSPIGGSEAAAAAGIDPHRSRVMLWLEKCRPEVLARPESEAMRWGTLLEPVIVHELRERGYPAIATADGPTWEVTDPGRPWMIGHPDGLVTDENGGPDWLLEVKTAGAWAHRTEAWEGETIPIAYAAQVQHYLHLTDLRRCLLAVLVGGQRLEVREVHRDDNAIRLLLQLEEDFWTEYVVKDRQPPPGGSDSDRDALAALHPSATEGRVIRLDREHVGLLHELRARREQLDALTTQKAELENRLKSFMGDAETALDLSDSEVLRWPNYSARRIDTARLKKERPDVYDEYAVANPSRRFNVI